VIFDTLFFSSSSMLIGDKLLTSISNRFLVKQVAGPDGNPQKKHQQKYRGSSEGCGATKETIFNLF
jgi:hypothetical protein